MRTNVYTIALLVTVSVSVLIMVPSTGADTNHVEEDFFIYTESKSPVLKFAVVEGGEVAFNNWHITLIGPKNSTYRIYDEDEMYEDWIGYFSDDELEPDRRGIYAGAVGYFSFTKSLDTCIIIRTIIFKDNQAYVQAGAGIVADSVPANEYKETVNKAKAQMLALELVD